MANRCKFTELVDVADGSGAIGYVKGGATVTQATNRSTGVTINALTGAITGNGTSLAAH